MATLLGRTYSRQELLRYAGNIDQIAHIRPSELRSGRQGGMGVYEVITGSGLVFQLLPDRCMDIGSLSYKGINLSFLSKNGWVSPAYAVPYEREFNHYMNGGMLFTCGLRNTGTLGRDDDGEFHPLHGRIGITPAENVYGTGHWEGDDYILEAGGTMRESFLFGVNLVLRRKITTKLGSGVIEIHDIIENCDSQPSPLLFLYHFNFGFPFLDAECVPTYPGCEATARTEAAQLGFEERGQISPPIDDFFEHVYFRRPNETIATSKVENRRLGIGAQLKWETKNLPVMTQWKSMRSGDYALGMEPGNTMLRGIKGERDAGELPMIEGFSSREYRLSLSVYDLS